MPCRLGLSTGGDSPRGIAVASREIMQNSRYLDIATLHQIRGGAGQAELRELARKWCPQVYNQNKNAPTLTRAMGERCLDEAGFGSYKSQLDQYFPRK
jgi:hypothetical protein